MQSRSRPSRSRKRTLLRMHRNANSDHCKAEALKIRQESPDPISTTQNPTVIRLDKPVATKNLLFHPSKLLPIHSAVAYVFLIPDEPLTPIRFLSCAIPVAVHDSARCVVAPRDVGGRERARVEICGRTIASGGIARRRCRFGLIASHDGPSGLSDRLGKSELTRPRMDSAGQSSATPEV